MEDLALATSDQLETSAPFIVRERRAWQRCRHWIEQAIADSPGAESIADIEAAIEAGDAIFWAGENSALVARIAPDSEALLICYCGGDGDLEALARLWLPQMVYFARLSGCRYVTLLDQPARTLAKAGHKLGLLRKFGAGPFGRQQWPIPPVSIEQQRAA